MQEPFDCVIRGGRVATAGGSFMADIGVRGEQIAAIGRGLGPRLLEIDATDRLVLPGGIDAHCHIEQMTAAGIVNADTFLSATTSAAFGGTTTVIPFAAQHLGKSLKEAVADYHRLARQGAIIDYALHMIVADPTPETVTQDIPALVAEGHGSIKVFMTYDRLKVDDEPMIDVLLAARNAGAMVCVHAENHGMLAWMGKRLVERGYTAPRYHALAHPRLAEIEAFGRLIALSRLVDQPIMIFHVSTAEGAAMIRQAQGEGVKVYAETCPHYLLLDAGILDQPGTAGAKWLCSPPMRQPADSEALWTALARGDLSLVSSDHAPFRYDESGKLRAGPNATFKQMANGMPGLEARLPVMFDAAVSKGRLGLDRFVEITATAPARIYNLAPGKGAIQPGADADLVLWDPDREVTLEDDAVHDATGYSPYHGRTVRGWPDTVLLRGQVIVRQGACLAEPGTGRFLPRAGGEPAKPTGRLPQELDPARNGGAVLIEAIT